MKPPFCFKTRSLFFVLLALAAGSRAVSAADQPVKLPDSGYIAQSRAAFPDFPPPPLPESGQGKSDVAEVLAWQARRTAEDCARLKAETYTSYGVMYGALSPFPAPLPEKAAAFFRRVRADLDYSVGILKLRHKRPRPFSRGRQFRPCHKKTDGYSYPSGNAVNAFVYALILSDLEPLKRDAFLSRAREIALNRVIAGVHYPSDIAAGEKLAGEIYGILRKERSFTEDLDLLRAELSSAGRPQ